MRSIFSMRKPGSMLKGIAAWLNAERAPTRRGGRWHAATVRYIQDNPKYLGMIEYYFRWREDGTRVIQEGEHVPIVAG